MQKIDHEELERRAQVVADNCGGMQPHCLVVGHAAALSRYFWPSPSGGKKPQLQNLKQKRGEFLRNVFKLDEHSPLHNRDLRNAWEHFDGGPIRGQADY